jgi:hypothetical protein
VHHAHREQHWRALEIIEPENTAPIPAGIGRCLLLADGPFGFLKGNDGEQYITAARCDGQWWITPDTSASPRREIPPGGWRACFRGIPTAGLISDYERPGVTTVAGAQSPGGLPHWRPSPDALCARRRETRPGDPLPDDCRKAIEATNAC